MIWKNWKNWKNNVYTDPQTDMGNREWRSFEWAILAPTNKKQINVKIMSLADGDVVEWSPVDSVVETERVTWCPVEFLDSLELSGVPFHKLRLKVDVPAHNFGTLRLYNGT